jgi:transcriptional regulator with XRE-family HTH domain
MINFGKSLKELRTQKGFSQDVFATKIGVHVTNLSKYERDLSMPSLEIAEKMANALEISMDNLVYGSDTEKAQKKIIDAELLTMFTKAQLLEDDDRKCVKSFLKAFLFQKDMIKQLS